jgi:hypothetical protein
VPTRHVSRVKSHQSPFFVPYFCFVRVSNYIFVYNGLLFALEIYNYCLTVLMNYSASSNVNASRRERWRLPSGATPAAAAASSWATQMGRRISCSW